MTYILPSQRKVKELIVTKGMVEPERRHLIWRWLKWKTQPHKFKA